MMRSNEEQSDTDAGYGNQKQRYNSNLDRSGLIGGSSVYGGQSGAGGSIGGIGSTGGYYGETDNKSIGSTPSKISKFTYSGKRNSLLIYKQKK